MVNKMMNMSRCQKALALGSAFIVGGLLQAWLVLAITTDWKAALKGQERPGNSQTLVKNTQ